LADMSLVSSRLPERSEDDPSLLLCPVPERLQPERKPHWIVAVAVHGPVVDPSAIPLSGLEGLTREGSRYLCTFV
jgi:hypothetical protein